MCRAVAVLVVFAAMAFLSGCQTLFESQQSTMKRLLDVYIGHSIAEFSVIHGTSQSTIDFSATEKAFQWEITQETTGVSMLMPGTNMIVSRGPQTLVCRISMIATTSKKSPSLGDWIITRWSWQGAC